MAELKIGGGVKLTPALAGGELPIDLKAGLVGEVVGPISLQYVPFSQDQHFTIGDNDPQRPWQSGSSKNTTAVKWGQFKLLIEEVQFLTLYWDPIKVPDPVAVYVGSAVGTHIAVLADMFPQFTFHLYDERKHDENLKSNEKIKIHQQLFTDLDAKQWAGRQDVFFISDIRSGNYKRDDEFKQAYAEANEKLVEVDMNRQMEWVKAIKPVRASLKFRLPYTWDFVVAKGKTRSYLDGLVYIQAWGPVTTTETRLVPNEDLGMRDWNYAAHQDMMFYHNTRVRVGQPFLNPLTRDRTRVDHMLGLWNDYDSILTTTIIMEYLTKFGVKPTKDNVVPLLKAMILGANKGKYTLYDLRVGGKHYAEIDDE